MFHYGNCHSDCIFKHYAVPCGMKKLALSAFLPLLLVLTLHAQKRVVSQATFPQAADVVFQKTIDYLLEHDYFIANADRATGFIQATQFVSIRKALSAKSGEQRTYNFFIRPGDEEHTSTVRLQIHIATKMFGGDIHNKTYHFKDDGISKDQSLYDEVLEGLKGSGYPPAVSN